MRTMRQSGPRWLDAECHERATSTTRGAFLQRLPVPSTAARGPEKADLGSNHADQAGGSAIARLQVVACRYLQPGAVVQMRPVPPLARVRR